MGELGIYRFQLAERVLVTFIVVHERAFHHAQLFAEQQKLLLARVVHVVKRSELVGRAVAFALEPRLFGFQPVHFGALARDLFAYFVQLTVARQKVGQILPPRTARHRALRTEHVALERYDLERETVFVGDIRGVADIVHDKGVPQQVGNDVFEIRVVFHQFVGKPKRAALVQRAADIFIFRAGFHRRYRQKSNPAAAAAFEVFYQVFRVVGIRRYDILRRRAERRFHGDVVLLLGLDDRGHHALDTRGKFFILLGREQQSLDRGTVPLERFLHADDKIFLCRQHGQI